MPTIDEFHYAIQLEDLNKVEEMLSQDPTLVNSTDFLGRPPLQNPCWDGNIPMIQLLISKGADVNAQNRDGVTPLHSAVSKGDPRAIKLLLEKGANVNAKNKNGETPLHVAAEFHFINTDVADLLLRYSTDPAAKNNWGKTPLDVAIKERVRGPMVDLLRAVIDGTDPTIRALYPKAGALQINANPQVSGEAIPDNRPKRRQFWKLWK